jgi:hypothetical protein
VHLIAIDRDHGFGVAVAELERIADAIGWQRDRRESSDAGRPMGTATDQQSKQGRQAHEPGRQAGK